MSIEDREAFRLYRWDELPLEKVTEMVSRKIVSGTREMVAQHYMKKGALVPIHAHESEQMTYVLQGALRALVNGDEVIVREGEILHVPPHVPHQAEAIEDTFTLDLFCPIRPEWLDQPPASRETPPLSTERRGVKTRPVPPATGGRYLSYNWSVGPCLLGPTERAA